MIPQVRSIYMFMMVAVASLMWDSFSGEDSQNDAPQFISFSQPQAMRFGPDSFDGGASQSVDKQGIMSFSQPMNYQDDDIEEDKDKFAVALVSLHI